MPIRRARNHRHRFGFVFEVLEDRRVLATLSGQVVNDLNGNGIIDVDEPGLQGIHVFIDSDGNQQLDRGGIFIEPDDFAANEQLTVANPNVLLSLADKENKIVTAATDENPMARTITAELDPKSLASTGGHVFGYDEVTFFNNVAKLRMDFFTPVSSVAIDFTGEAPFASTLGILELYDVNDNLIGSDATSELPIGVSETLFATAENIAYAVAFNDIEAAGGGRGRLDNLRLNSEGSELWTVTGPNGEYEFKNLDAAVYNVGIDRPANWTKTFPQGSTQSVDLTAADVSDASFGLQTNTFNGTVFEDRGVIGTFEPGTDTPMAGAIIYLDDNSNQRLDRDSVNIEPDDFPSGTTIADRFDSIHVSTADVRDVPRNHVVIVEGQSTTGTRVFATAGGSGFSRDQRLRIDFENSVTSVSIDFVSTTDSGRGRILGFEVGSESPVFALTQPLAAGETETISVTSEFSKIEYVIIFADTFDGNGTPVPSGNFDDLRIEGVPFEPVAVSDANGRYEHTPLENSTYNVRQELAPGDVNTIPSNGVYRELVEDGQTTELNFGVAGLSWQNKVNNLDVNNDGFIIPFDALEIINELNNPQYSNPVDGRLPDPPDPVPKFFDVNDDGFVTPFDAIQIINFLNNNPGGGVVAAVATGTRSAAIDAVHAAAVLDLDDDLNKKRMA